MRLKDRFRQAREKAGLTQEELRIIVGVSQNAISKIESGETKKPRDIIKYARALGVSADYLEDGGPEKTKQRIDTTQGDDLLSDAEPIMYYRLMEWGDLHKWSSKMHISESHSPLFKLIVNSENMAPKYQVGETITIHSDLQPNNNDCVIVLINNRACMREYLTDGDKVILKSSNPDWPNKFELMGPSIKIIGVVVEKSQKMRVWQ